MGKDESGGSRIAMGCALGCGIIFLSALVIGVASFFAIRHQITVVSERFTTSMVEEMERLEEEGGLDEARMAVMRQLLGTARSEEASAFTRIACWAVFAHVATASEDEEEAALEAGQEVADFVSQNPDSGFFALVEFMGEHPEFKSVMESILDDITSGAEFQWEIESGSPPEDESDDDESPEDEDAEDEVKDEADASLV